MEKQDSNDMVAREAELATTPCSAETSESLYRRLNYYRNFMPFAIGVSEAQYATTQEAKIADAALTAYRDETGVASESKPS